MDINLQNLKTFLEKSDRHVLDVFENKLDGKTFFSKITLKKITDTYGGIQQLFVHLKEKQGIREVGVIKHKPNGTSHKPEGIPFVFTLGKEKPLEGFAATGAHAETVSAPPAALHQNPQKNFNSMPQDSMPYQQIQQGLNAVQQDRLELKQEKIDDLKSSLEKAEKKFDKKETQVDGLVMDLRQAKSDLANFQQKMELEILKEQLKKEPSIPPEVLGKLMDSLPMVVGAMANRSASAPTQSAGLGSLENLSKVKQDLVSFVSDVEITDIDAANFMYAAYGMSTIPQMKTQIIAITQEHNVQNAFN